MPFNTDKDIASVLLEFDTTYQEANFIQETQFEINPFFDSRLKASLESGVVFNSEYAICENIIAPILREIWLQYRETLQFWSHQPLNYNDKLCGIPDYMITQRSPRGKIILEPPHLILVEAKKDDFEAGWGQCLVELVTAQKLNANPDQSTVFGIVSNGKLWEFGKLAQSTFTKNIKYYTLEELVLLMGAIDSIFAESLVLTVTD